MAPQDETLNLRAQQFEKEFHEAVAELHRVGEEDPGEWTDDYENRVSARNGMIELTKLAETAIQLGDKAIQAQAAAINANNPLLSRSYKRNQMTKRLQPQVNMIRSDLRIFRSLTPAITNNWFKDPTGRHQERFRGEGEWTDQVRDNEVESIDKF